MPKTYLKLSYPGRNKGVDYDIIEDTSENIELLFKYIIKEDLFKPLYLNPDEAWTSFLSDLNTPEKEFVYALDSNNLLSRCKFNQVFTGY